MSLPRGAIGSTRTRASRSLTRLIRSREPSTPSRSNRLRAQSPRSRSRGLILRIELDQRDGFTEGDFSGWFVPGLRGSGEFPRTTVAVAGAREDPLSRSRFGAPQTDASVCRRIDVLSRIAHEPQGPPGADAPTGFQHSLGCPGYCPEIDPTCRAVQLPPIRPLNSEHLSRANPGCV